MPYIILNLNAVTKNIIKCMVCRNHQLLFKKNESNHQFYINDSPGSVSNERANCGK